MSEDQESPEGTTVPDWRARVASVGRRRRLDAALRRASPLWFSGALPVAGAALLLFLGLQALGIVFLALCGVTLLLVAISLVAISAVPRDLDALEGAAAVDRQLGLRDTLKAALDQRPARAVTSTTDRSVDHRAHLFAQHLATRADALAQNLDPKQFAPVAVSPLIPLGALLLVTAVVLWSFASPLSSNGFDLAESRLGSERTGDGADPTTAETESGNESSVASLDAETLARLQLQKMNDPRFEGVELESMTAEELGSLLKELRSGAGLQFDESELAGDAEANRAQTDGKKQPGAEAKERAEGTSKDDDGLRELRRPKSDDPFAAEADGGPEGETGERAMAGENSHSDDVRRIDLPPMPSPDARRAPNAEAGAAMAMAGMQNPGDQTAPSESSQFGAGGGDSGGPQGPAKDPLGQGTSLAVTLELALLQAEQAADRPVERSIEHRASEAADAKVRRRGLNSADTSAVDQHQFEPILSSAQRARVGRYFDPDRWPKTDTPP